uniref:Uncharacterized protein n=1 Tax=Glossina austeni TaxID=7395 RepID=A0A1A9URE3_GLOAU
MNLKISNVHSANNGVVMIDCCGDNKRKKVKSVIENKIPKECGIMMPKKFNPRFKLTNVNFSYGGEELLDKLRNQNPILDASKLRIVGFYTVLKQRKAHHTTT